MDPNLINNLRRYFVECPKKNDFRLTKEVRKDIRRALFEAASCNGKYIDRFFPDIGNLELDSQSQKSYPSSLANLRMSLSQPCTKGSFDWIIKNDIKVDPSHPGRPCVRKFTKGEPTYRCL